jgi:hypothetical protein
MALTYVPMLDGTGATFYILTDTIDEVSDARAQVFKVATGAETDATLVSATDPMPSALYDEDGNPLSFAVPVELTATPTIYSAGAAVALDSLHTTIMTFAGAARGNGGTGRVLGARLVCKHATFDGDVHLVLARKSITGTTAGDTLSVSDPDKLEVFGELAFDFETSKLGSGGVANAHRSNLPLDYKCDAGTDDIYGILQLWAVGSTTPDTFAADDFVPFLICAKD